MKGFVSLSIAYEFHTVLGQYLNYRTFIEVQEPERTLYLAVKRSVYDSFFRDDATELVVTKFGINIVIINEQSRIVEQWMKN